MPCHPPASNPLLAMSLTALLSAGVASAEPVVEPFEDSGTDRAVSGEVVREAEPDGDDDGSDGDAPRITAGYDRGFVLRADDGSAELKIQGRAQPRFAYEAPGDSSAEGAFSLNRARITLVGHILSERLAFELEVGLGKGLLALKDGYLEYQLQPALLLRAGQYKKPFSRQQIVSSGRQQLVDRSITDKAFGAGRDIGVTLHNDYESSPTFEYAVGLYNGTTDKVRYSGDVLVDPLTGEGELLGGSITNVPPRAHPSVVVRLGYNHGGIKGYREADLEGGPLRFSVGASGWADFDLDGDDASALRGQLDAIVKAHGFSANAGLYVASAQAGPSFGQQAFDAVGAHLQAGYLIADRFSPVVRYGWVAPATPVGLEGDLHELVGGLTVYFHEHAFNWQTDVGALIQEAGVPGTAQTTFVLRSQLQLAF